jgi:hypothetical protein
MLETTRRPRHRWEVSIKMDPIEVCLGGISCIHLAQDKNHWQALGNTVMNLQVPQNAGNFLNV